MTLRRRSGVDAALLTPLVLLVTVGVLYLAFSIGGAIGGSVGGAIGALLGEVAVLAFLTLRAYPPEVKPPWIRLFLVTLLFSVVIPAIYLSWLWLTGRKWPEQTENGWITPPT